MKQSTLASDKKTVFSFFTEQEKSMRKRMAGSIVLYFSMKPTTCAAVNIQNAGI